MKNFSNFIESETNYIGFIKRFWSPEENNIKHLVMVFADLMQEMGDEETAKEMRNTTEERYYYLRGKSFYDLREKALEKSDITGYYGLLTLNTQNWKDILIICLKNQNYHYRHIESGNSIIAVKPNRTFYKYTNNTNRNAYLATPRDRTPETLQQFNLKQKDLKEINVKEVPFWLLEAMFWGLMMQWQRTKFGNFKKILRL